ncbi:MAG: patatin-like phospholipase family protein [Betaproteobacteria bacterium]
MTTTTFRTVLLLLAAPLLLLAGCASRPVNPPVTAIYPDQGYRLVSRPHATNSDAKDSLVVLTFSGGGTRAAAFSYGVLEVLRRTEIVGPLGNKIRLIDAIDVITGVSGGSFTALAYGLYGDKLFAEYEERFLKRNVQGELTSRFLSPSNWSALWSETWGRSEMAAQLYDDILFNGATFADLERGNGPLIMVMATDISTGSRFGYTQQMFDLICSDLKAVPLSRAAATSSAVPLVLSPVTLNNYGGTCNYAYPSWLLSAADPDNPARPAARALKRMEETRSYQDSKDRPYLHLVDGGLADNLGMRAVLETLEELEAVRMKGGKTPLDNVKRIVVIVVNSLSSPKTNWDLSERPPGSLDILLKATGVPIDRYSYETVELLRDIVARWDMMRRIRASPAFDAARDPTLTGLMSAPSTRLYAIDVSFPQLKDKREFEYLNELPTSFVLKPEEVDRLRAAAGTILLESRDFQRLLTDVGATIVPSPAPPAAAAR